MMAILVILGTFMEWIAIAFITVPVFAPVVVGMAPELGLDPAWAAVWFGVLFVMNIQIYFLSPPFGPACFWLKSVAPPRHYSARDFHVCFAFYSSADNWYVVGDVLSRNCFFGYQNISLVNQLLSELTVCSSIGLYFKEAM